MKKLIAFLLTLCLLLSSANFVMAEDTRTFTDSTGRTVTVPATITRVAVSGPFTQYVVFALAPEMMVGISSEWNDAAITKLNSEYANLPILGQLYGGKGELNLEQLLLVDPDVVIDVGESKKTIIEDMDSLTAQTGIPFVHIDASLSSFDATFTALGELLGKEDEAKPLADYCARIYALVKELSEKVKKTSLLYITGDKGLNVIAKGSYHSEVIDLLSDNLAVVESPSSKGTGNEVDMELILLWNPEIILFAPGSIYATVSEDATWQNLTAIQNGNYYLVPEDIQNWMGFPPGCQRLMGMLWLGKLLYKDASEYDLYEQIAEYYKLFYHCELTVEEYTAIVADPIGK